MKWLLGLCFTLALPTHAWELGKLGHFKFQAVADHVYVMQGPLTAPNKTNQGFMNNPGIIVAEHGVIVVDPGSSLNIGRQVLSEIAKITPKPVLAVFNTHIHGDHWLANQAIKVAYPNAKFYAHPNMIAQAEQVGQTWLSTMLALTEGQSLGTQLVAPTIAALAKSEMIVDGQHFRIHAVTPAHTDTDIMLEHTNSQTLFLGDNGFNQRFGQFDSSSSVLGNIQALQQAADLHLKVYVPGHGPSGTAAQVVQPYLDYLLLLKQVVQAGYDDGLADYEIKAQARSAFHAYHGWAGFDFNFGKHINRLYLALELSDE